MTGVIVITGRFSAFLKRWTRVIRQLGVMLSVVVLVVIISPVAADIIVTGVTIPEKDVLEKSDGMELREQITVGIGSPKVGTSGTVEVNKKSKLKTTDNVVLARFPKDNGSLTVTGEGSELDVGKRLVVGFQGKGELNIRDKGAVTVTDVLAIGSSGFSANGTVSVSGAGSSLNVGVISIGGVGLGGTLEVKDGAKVTVQNELVSSSLGKGIVTVNGNGSEITANNLVLSGTPRSPGTQNIVDGGKVTVQDTVSIAIGKNTVGTVKVTGAGSVLTAKQINIGVKDGAPGQAKGILDIPKDANQPVVVAKIDVYKQGTLKGAVEGQGNKNVKGDVNVHEGGKAAAGDSIGTLAIEGNYTQEALGTLEIEIEGTDLDEINTGLDLVDLLEISSSMSSGSSASFFKGAILDFRFGSFPLQIGDEFTFLTAPDIFYPDDPMVNPNALLSTGYFTGRFSMNVRGYDFEVFERELSTAESSLVLSVEGIAAIPEPASFVLLSIGGVMVYLLRRKLDRNGHMRDKAA